MSQVKIYARRTTLEKHRVAPSDAIDASVIETLSYPADKRFHRFIGLEAEDFMPPTDRGPDYTVIEISMFEGRSMETKKALIRALFVNIERACDIAPQDVEITIFETPKGNWGIRGVPGDELSLGYRVEV